MSFLENNFFLLAITFGIFFFAKLLQKKTGHTWTGIIKSYIADHRPINHLP